MFVSLHQPVTKREMPNLFIFIFVDVSAWKERRPDCLFYFWFYNKNQNKEIWQYIHISTLVFSHQLMQKYQILVALIVFIVEIKTKEPGCLFKKNCTV